MERRRKGIVALSVVALGVYLASLLLASSIWRSDASSAATTGTTACSLEFDGRKRSYFIHVPAVYDEKKPVPLVLVLHGGGQSPESAEWMSGMSAKADAEGFIAVYPSGTSAHGHAPTWNSGACCAYAMANHVNDVGYLRALINQLQLDYAIDPKRIFSTGISNGGMMSYRLACEAADKIAAIAPVEGAQDLECRPAAPVSVIVFHGTSDHLVPFNGGTTPFQFGSKRSDTPVDSTVSFWVNEDSCSSTPLHTESAEIYTDKYSGCKAGTGVTLYAIQGGRHMWPGGRMSGNHVAATDLMWAFFAAHPKP